MKFNGDELEVLMDDLMLECDLPYESVDFSYDVAKKLVVSGTLDLVENTMNNPELNDHQKVFSLAASIAYLNLENFYLRTLYNV